MQAYMFAFTIGWWIWPAIIFFFIFVTAAGLRGLPYYRHLQTGMQFLKSQDFESAVYCFQKARDLQPYRWMPRDHMARAYLGQGNIEAAIRSFQEAVEIDPRRMRSQLGLGMCLLKQGDFQKSVDVLHKVVEALPRHRDAHLALGEAYLSLGNFDEAQDAYMKGAPSGQSIPEILYGLAVISLGKGEKKLAKQQLNEILVQDTMNKDARLTLAAIARDEGDHAESLRLCEEALENEPESSETQLAVGISKAALGRWKDAREHIEKAIRIDPGLGGADYHLARAHSQLGEPARAIESLRKSVERGFASRIMIQEEPAFTPLRDVDGFESIIEKART
ncbi:MAG: tetratricopeptide repeat protein [Planctomycetota bacterium]|nr:tetratricopeptide repeat protein [Planctomycetota bacterium]